MAEAAKTQLTEKELNDLREIHISINWRGFKKAWMKMFHDAPFAGYQAIMRNTENVSRKMMTGKSSLLGMPLGIIVRNTSRAMHNSAEGRYYRASHVIGALGALGAIAAGTVMGGPILAGAVGAGVAGVVGSWGTYVAAGAISAAVLSIPAYTTATLICSTLVGAGAAIFSTIVAAPVNLLIGYRRSKAALQGHKLNEAQMEALRTEFDKESPQVKYENDLENFARHGLRALKDLNPTRAEALFNSLKEEFDAAAAQGQTATATAAAPKAKTHQP